MWYVQPKTLGETNEQTTSPTKFRVLADTSYPVNLSQVDFAASQSPRWAKSKTFSSVDQTGIVDSTNLFFERRIAYEHVAHNCQQVVDGTSVD